MLIQLLLPVMGEEGVEELPWGVGNGAENSVCPGKCSKQPRWSAYRSCQGNGDPCCNPGHVGAGAARRAEKVGKIFERLGHFEPPAVLDAGLRTLIPTYYPTTTFMSSRGPFVLSLPLSGFLPPTQLEEGHPEEAGARTVWLTA